ncbi:MAG: C-terminal binding protein [Candidatus Tectomicrobia bacterium]|uniref:C-terminal binding protein n=1 Tax=Tectimicrobiota bacterium TaxID=2528274 RepID=A0A932MLN3_UNCTE|nr:C-terminal binding protein [Candidatus Tectomicrobia bacterium]
MNAAKQPLTVAVAGTRFGPLDLEREVLAPLKCRVVEGPGADDSSLIELCREADAVISGSIPRFTGTAINAFERCRIIARGGIGVDNIDVEAAKRRGIAVTNVPDYCIDEVSDHAMAFILFFARKLDAGVAEVRRGGWGVAPIRPIAPLKGAVLGILGIGRIGAALGRKARAFGMKLLACDPYAPEAVFKKLRAEKVELDDLYRRSDYISLHAPLTPGTRGIIGREALARMKPDAVLVNVARGELVDEGALAGALREKRIRAAGLDVLSEEPPRAGHPLVALPNCHVTPHSAWYSTAAQDDLRRKAALEVVRCLKGKPLKYRVG